MSNMRMPEAIRTAGVMIVLVTLFLWAAGCSEEPTQSNSVGANLVKTAVTVHDTTVGAIADSTFKQPLPMDGAYNLVGRFGGYTAYTTMQFGVPVRDTITVLNARVRLRATTWFGDSSSAVRFTMHRIIRSWTQPGLEWDSVDASFYDPTPIGAYEGSVEADTQDVFITIGDTAEVRYWFSSTNDPAKYGFILIPDPSMNVVRGFASFVFTADTSSTYPTLIVDALGTSGVRDTAEYTFGADTFVGNIDNLDSDPSLTYVQAGVVYRSTLMFDIGFIPKGAIVNSAEMLLHLDPATTQLSKVTADSAVAAHAVSSASDLRVIESSFVFGRRKEGYATTWSFDLRRATQLWANGTNYGILLRATTIPEFSSFDRYTFFNQNAADSLRPRLRVIYSIPK
jgi:hypothetical protein